MSDELKAEVFAAAEALTKRGERVSVRSIRAELGGGTPNRLTPLVREWKEATEAKAKEVDELLELPEETREALREPTEALLARMWVTVREATTRELDELQEAYESKIKTLEGEAEDARALTDDLSAELEEAKGRVDSLARELEATQTKLSDLERGHQKLREELAAASARAEATERSNEQLTAILERLPTQQSEAEKRPQEGL